MKTLTTSYPLIDSVIEQSAPYVDQCVQEYIVSYNKRSSELVSEGKAPLRELTQDNLDYYAADIKVAMIKALGNYILTTDSLVSVKYSWANYKGVSITISLLRDGNTEYLDTESIIAHGQVQRRHVRYIVKTSLRKLSVDLTKRLNKIDKAQYELDYMLGVVAREEANLAKLEAVTIEDITNEVFKYFIDRGIQKHQMWNNLIPEAKLSYGSEEALLQYYQKQVDEKVAHLPHLIKISKNRIKEFKGKLPKLETKLAAIKAAL